MTILMDITRIFRRAPQLTPTGIDRVELAYALHLLKRDDVRYIVRYRQRVWSLRRQAVPRFLSALEARWNGAKIAAARSGETERLEAFLALPAGTLAEPHASGTTAPALRRSASASGMSSARSPLTARSPRSIRTVASRRAAR